MYLGDVKAESLKIMNINSFMNISYLDIDGLKEDGTYAGYLYAMNGAINRAFDRFYIKEAIAEPIASAVTVETPETLDLNDVGINDVLARMLPSFIVGDVFAMDEPEVAAYHRNLFEASVDEYLQAQRNQQTQVETIYGVDL